MKLHEYAKLFQHLPQSLPVAAKTDNDSSTFQVSYVFLNRGLGNANCFGKLPTRDFRLLSHCLDNFAPCFIALVLTTRSDHLFLTTFY